MYLLFQACIEKKTYHSEKITISDFKNVKFAKYEGQQICKNNHSHE